MNDGDASTVKLAELLRHPDDLDKVGALKSEFARKKAAIDSQLKLGLNEQLQLTKAGMDSLNDSQRLTNLIKEEMMTIDRLCAEAQNMIRNFPEIDAVAQAHRNFVKVKTMKSNIETFNEKLEDIAELIKEDDEDLETQPNLIKIHYGLTQVRNLRDDAMEQARRADDTSIQHTLQDHFKRLDDVIDDFDEHVGHACMNLIALVEGNSSDLVVRLAIIIEEEEKFDNRIKELRDAQKEYKDLASRFKSLAVGPTQVRGYKDKFLEAIKIHAQDQFDVADQAFLENPDRIDKATRWYFQNLNVVKLGMSRLMPKKWKIFKTYVRIYHQLMYDWLTSKAEDQSVTPIHMLAIIHWKDKYYAKMHKLGVSAQDLSPPLPGGGDSDLVREYRQLIITKVEEWMNQMNKTDRGNFLARRDSALEHNEHGHFRTKTLSDMWRMLREQLVVASNSDLTDVTEGVTDAMFRALKTRQDMWESLIVEELARCSRPQLEPESMQGLQDWLIALANDQIVCIINPDEDAITPSKDITTAQLGYLSSFRRDYESLVSAEYATAATAKFDSIKEGFTDLGFRCISVFAQLIFAVDFRAVMTDFFTPAWYAKPHLMGQIMSTYEDYLGDYAPTVPDLLHDILIEELAKQLLLAYLACVRNRAAKFRRTDPFDERMRSDVVAVFSFFERYRGSYDAIREQWRVVEGFLGLLSCEKHAVAAEFGRFLGAYWDVRLSWVEAVLRTRDDVEWGPLGDGKAIMKAVRARAAEQRTEGQEATIMGEVN